MKADGHVQLFLGERDIERADRSLPHGEVCVRTLRSPEKPRSNEDAAAVIQLGDGSLVLAVADGVGGMPAAREASNAAVQTLARALRKLPDDTPDLRSAILDAVDKANHKVLELARGAATTLVVAQLDAKRLRSYHVGDSELLVVGQRGRIKQRVVPHSVTGFAVEAGLLNEKEAMRHNQRHLLFNVIGSPDMRVEVGPTLQLAVHDTVLLASDGLFDNLFVAEIVDSVCSGPLVAAANRLVERAQRRMRGEARADMPCKPDDLTVVLFRPRR
ncbi:MAG: protein phosphatase 2C domain-containing protein [Gammaproteobacteria bacterium]